MSKKTAPMGSPDAIFGAAFGVVFMLYWTGSVIKRRGPLIMTAFGVFGLLTITKGLIDNIKAYRRRKREMDFYGESSYTGAGDYNRQDPWEAGYSKNTQESEFSGQLGDIHQYTAADGTIYCPYCGVKIAHDFEFCPHCGKKLPF